jgi:hypothetical protein
MKIALRVLVWVAIGGLVYWFTSHLAFKEVQVNAPLEGDARYNPFYAAIRLSSELGAEATWERVFSVPPEGTVLYLSGWNWAQSKPRRERLKKWVEEGGRLVVDASLLVDEEEFETWSGIGQREVEIEDEDEDDDEAEDEDVELVPDKTPFAFGDEDDSNCEKLSEDGGDRKLRMCWPNWGQSLTTTRRIQWALRGEQGIHALRVAVGKGSVTMLNADPFQYREFLLGDNPHVFVAATQIRRGDTLRFLTEEESPSIVALMWRFGAPAVLLLLAGVALGIWRSGPRFGPRVASTDTARRSLAEQIRGTGQFALRFGGGEALYDATLRALRDAAIRRFPAYDTMSSADRVALVARVSGIGESDLSPAMNYTGPRNPHELRDAIAILETARRRLLTARK